MFFSIAVMMISGLAVSYFTERASRKDAYEPEPVIMLRKILEQDKATLKNKEA